SILLLVCQRALRDALMACAKLRISQAYGYLRLEAEAVALVHVLRDSPELAVDWMSSGSNAGNEFFYKSRRKVEAVLKKYDLLKEAYSYGSDVAFHARMPTAARGLVFDGTRGSMRGSQMLSEQEIDPEDARQYFDD